MFRRNSSSEESPSSSSSSSVGSTAEGRAREMVFAVAEPRRWPKMDPVTVRTNACEDHPKSVTLPRKCREIPGNSGNFREIRIGGLDDGSNSLRRWGTKSLS